MRPARGNVLGWIVLRRGEGRWLLDFDGELHQQRAGADKALHEALTGGHRAVLVEATWVRDAVVIGGPL
ncbi:hypothetical protein [Dactylosporangium salmoneum]